MDVDEFIVPEAKNTSIPDVLKNYEQYGGLALNWLRFGTSGFNRRPPGGVLESYTKCSLNNHVKTIANLAYTVGPQPNTHSFIYSAGTGSSGKQVQPYAVNVHGKKVERWLSDPPTSGVMVVRHYMMKSREDFEKKLRRLVDLDLDFKA